MNEELAVLLTVAERLEKASIPYLVSGSVAANYYTIPRMTRDIDVVIELKEKDIGRFVRAFTNDFLVDEDMVNAEVARRGMFNVIHRKHILKVDFILGKDSEFQDATFRRKKKVTITDVPLWLISPEDLILAKLLWAKDSFSELQISDVRHLLKSAAVSEPDYLQTWVSKLGLEAIYAKAIS